MHKILGLLTLLGALSWASTSWAMESIHGGTCWIERQGDTLKVVSFNDRQAEFWNSFSLGEQVREALASVKVLAQGEVTISMACSDLGHRLVIRGASVQNQRFCLYTDMKFSSFEHHRDPFR